MGDFRPAPPPPSPQHRDENLTDASADPPVGSGAPVSDEDDQSAIGGLDAPGPDGDGHGDVSTAAGNDGDDLAARAEAAPTSGTAERPGDPSGASLPGDPATVSSTPARQPSNGEGPARSTRVRRNAWILGMVAVVVVAGVAAFALTGTDSARSLHGTIDLLAPGDIAGTKDACRGLNEFADYGAGMTVQVVDGSGKVLGTARTVNVSTAGRSVAGDRCALEFDVKVGDASEYRVTIGRHGTQTYSRAELDADDWNVGFNLG